MAQNVNREDRFRSELLISGAVVVAMCSYAAGAPESPTVVRGNVQFTRDGDLTVIRASDRSIINFRSFDLARNETVQFIQPSSRASVLNRIRGDAPSLIDGSIIANGRVFFINPAGITFGPNSVINVGTLVAAAGNMSDSDFLRDNWQFTGLRGSVVNRGLINADTVAMLGRQVSNFGSINAPAGTVVMAAGEDILVGRRRDRVFAKISAAGQAYSEDKVTVTNAGTINAPGGQVAMAAADTFGAALFNAGTVKAQRTSFRSGPNGITRVSGVVDVSNTAGKGGEVEILGDRIELQGATIDARGTTGGGEVLVGGGVRGQGTDYNANTVFMDGASAIDASATVNGDGGTVVLWSDGVNLFTGDIAVRGGAESGNGGFVEVSGDKLGFYGKVDLAAPAGEGGELLLDPRDLRIQATGPATIPGVDEFSDDRNTDTIIGVGTITDVLKTGGSVTLAANRDLFVETNITFTLDLGVTEGGNLSLLAQRSIFVGTNISINTQGGDLLLSANQDGGNLLSRGVRALNTGVGNIELGAGSTIDTDAGSLTFRIGPVAGLANQFQPGTLKNFSASDAALSAGGGIVLDGQFIGNTGVDDFNVVNADGSVSLTAGTRIDARTIRILSTNNAGTLTFQGAANLNAPVSMVLRAESTVVGLGSVTFRDVSGGASRPLAFTVQQGSTLGDAQQAAASQFGGSLLPLTLNYISAAGNVVVTDASKFTGSDVTLNGVGGVNINTGAVTMNVNSLRITSPAGSTIDSAINISGSRAQDIGLGGASVFSFASNGTTLAMGLNGSITAASNIYMLQTGAVDLGALNAGANTVDVRGSTIGQSSGIITAATLKVDASDNVNLNRDNLVGTFSGEGTNGITFRNAQALSIGGLDTFNAFVNLSVDGLITQLAGSEVSTGDFNINSQGFTQQAGALLTIVGLSAVGTGDFIFDQAGNRTDVVAAQVTGKFHLVDLDDLQVGTVNGIVGIDPSEVIIDAGGPLDINAPIVSTGLVSLRGSSINQAGGANITADQLALVTTGGSADVFSGGNDVNTLAASIVGGSLRFRDTDDVTIGSFTSAFGALSGVSVGGGTTNALRSGGLLTFANSFTANGDSELQLRSGAGAVQTGGVVTVRRLVVRGEGTFTLEQANQIRRVAADNVPGGAVLNLSLRTDDANGLTVAAVDGVNGITTNGGNLKLNATAGSLSLNRAVNTGAGFAHLIGQGISQNDPQGNITAGGLALGGTGDITLANAGNAVGTLAGNFNGNLDFRNSAGVAVGTVDGVSGLTSNGGSQTMNLAGALSLNESLNAGAGAVKITAGGASSASGKGITGSTLEVIGNALGAFILDDTNAVGTVAADVDGEFSLNNTGALTIGTVGGTTGVDTNGNPITLASTGAMTQQANINSGAGKTILAGSGFNQAAGTITAGELGLVALGGGAWTLGGANDVDTLAAFTQGALVFNDVDGLTIGSVGSGFGTINGILSSGNDVTINAAGLTLNASIDAGPTGSGGIVILDSSAGVTQSAAAQIIARGLSLEGTGTFNLPGNNQLGKLAAVISGSLSINGSYSIGAVGSKPGIQGLTDLVLNFTSPLEIGSDIIVTGRLTLNGPGAFQTNGARIAGDQLVIIGTSSDLFELDTASNDFNFVAAKLIGGMTLFDANTLTVNAVNGTPIGSINGIDVDPADILLVMPGVLNLAAPISNPGFRVTLQTAGATQAAGARIVAGELALISNGAGVFNLAEPTNAVGKLAGFFSGSGLTFRNTGALTVGTITATPAGDLSGLFAPGQSVDLGTTGLLTLEQGIVAGELATTSAGVNQTGGIIITPQYVFSSTADVSLDKANQVGLIAGSATGNVSFTNNQAINVGTVGATSGISTGGGNLRLIAGDTTVPTGFGINLLAGNLDAGAGDMTLIGSSFLQNAGTNVFADQLGIAATADGAWLFTETGNDVNQIAAFTRGALVFIDSNLLIVGSAPVAPFGTANGILSSNNPVLLVANSGLLLLQSIDAGTSAIGLVSNAGALQLGGILKAEQALVFGSGDFFFTAPNQVNNLAGLIDGSLNYNGAGNYNIGLTLPIALLSPISGLATSGDMTLTSGGIVNINADSVLSSGTLLRVNSFGMTQDLGSSILAPEFVMFGLGAGDFILNSPLNDVGTIAADLIGELQFTDANILTVGDVDGVNGITINPAPVTITLPGLLTLNAPIITPGERITLNAGGAIQDNALSRLISGELVLVNFPGSPGADWTLQSPNNDVETLVARISGNLNYRDFDNLIVGTLGGTPIGTINGLFTGGNGLFVQTGLGLTLADNVNVGGSRARFLTGNGIDQAGGFIRANELMLEGTGLMNLFSANQVNLVAGNFVGQLNLTNDQPLTIGEVGGIFGITTGNNRANLNVTGLLTFVNNLDVGTSLADITSQGAAQAGGLILGGSLKVRGTGVFNLDAQNQVGTIAANVFGPFNFTNAAGFTVGTVDSGNPGELSGINSNSNNIFLRAGTDLAGFVIVQGPGANIVANGSRVVLQGSGFDQNLLASITAQDLALTASSGGTWSLKGDNDVNKFAAFTQGNLIFNDVNTLLIESIVTGTSFVTDVNGVFSSGNDVTITTGGKLTLQQSINAGTGITTLESFDGVLQQSGIILSAALSLQGTGDFVLPGDNQADVLAAVINGSLEYNSAISYSIGNVNFKNGVQVAGGNIELCSVAGILTIASNLESPDGRITICADGVDQLVGSLINAKELALIDTGPTNADWELNQPTNTVGVIAANVQGRLRYRDDDNLTIGTLNLVPVPGNVLAGITTNGDRLEITTDGAITIADNTPVIAAGNHITFRSYGATQGAGSSIFSSELLLLGNGVEPAGVNLGDFDLQSPLNQVSTLASSTFGFVKYRNATGLTIGSIKGTEGITTNEGDVYLRADSGGLQINRQINAGSSAFVRLQTINGSITQDTDPLNGAAITAGDLLVRTSGNTASATLANEGNRVENVAGDLEGSFRLVTSLGLRVTSLGDPLDGGTSIVGIDTTGGGPIGANIALTTTGNAQMLISQKLNAPGATIRLQSSLGNITQTSDVGDNPVMTAENLIVLTDRGSAFLEWSSNNVKNFAADMGGELRYRDASDLFITQIADPLGGPDISGIDTGGSDATIRAQNKITIERDITTDTLFSVKTTLQSFDSSIEQTGGRILTGELVLRSPGHAWLTSAGNDVDLLDARNDGGLNFVNSVALGIKQAVTSNANIRINNTGPITLLTFLTGDGIDAGNATVALIGSAGMTQQAQTRIVASNLYIDGTGAGNWSLGNTGTLNDVDTLAARINGVFRFDDTDSLTVGQVNGVFLEAAQFIAGINTTGNDAYLRSGTLGNLGGIDINRPITLGVNALLRLQTNGGDVNQGISPPDFAPIVAGRLLTLTLAPGHVNLENEFNQLGIIAGDVGDFYKIKSSTALTVDTLSDPLDAPTQYAGLRILGSEAFVQAPALTVNQKFDASLNGIGTSLVRFTVDDLQINNDGVTTAGFVRSGDSDTSGVWVRQLTDGRGFRIGDELTSAIRLTQAEMLRIFTPLLQLGDLDTGDITTSPGSVNLTSAGYDLVLRGRGTTINGGLLMNQAAKLTMWSELNGVSAPGQVTAGFLVLKGNGVFTLNNASNDFGRMSADIVGPNIVPVADALTVRDTNSLIVDFLDTRLLDGTGIVNLTGIDALSGNVRLTTGGAAADRLTLWPGVPDITDVVTAPDGSIFLTTNNLTINRLIETGSRVFIAPVTATRPIEFGGAAGVENPAFLSVDDAEINRIFAGRGIAAGGAAVSQILVSGFNYSGSFVQLQGAQIDFTNAVDMTGFGALLNLVSPDVRQQAAGSIKVDRLGLTGAGEFLLTASGNDFGVIGGDVGGLRLSDDNGFEIGFITVDAPSPSDPPTSTITGLRATGSAALITRGLGSGTENNVFINQNVQVGDKLVLASLALPGQTPLFYQSVGTTVTAPNMLMNGRMGVTLDQPFNSLPNISGLVNGGVITLRTNSNQNVNIISDFAFAPQAGDADQRTQSVPGGFDGLVNDGNINLTATGRLTLVRKLQGDELLIDSEGLGRTNGFLVANLFTFVGGGDIALGVGEAGDGVDGVNKVLSMALVPTRVMTDIDFANDAVTPLNIVEGAANILNGRVVLRAREMTFTGPFTMAAAPGAVDPESGAVRITTDILAINSNLAGEGGILVRPLTGGTAISVGAEVPGQLSLSGAELARLLTGRTVQIGSVTAGQINVGNTADLNYDLTLIGRGMTINPLGLGLVSGKTLFMNPQVTGVQQSTGRVLATNMLILGNGPVNMANAANEISNAAIEVNGAITLFNDIDLTIKSISAFDLSARNRVAKNGDSQTSNNKAIVNNVTASMFVDGDIDAGTSTVDLTVTDTLDIFAGRTVSGDAGVTIDPALMVMGPGTKVLAADGLVDLTIDDAHWDPTALIVGGDGVKITTVISGRTIRLGGSSIIGNAGELGLSDSELLVIGGNTPQVDINGKGAAEIIVSGDAGSPDSRFIDLTSAPYDLVLRSDAPGGKITFFRGFAMSGESLRFIGPSFVRSSVVFDTQSADQNSVRFDGSTTFGLVGSLDNPFVDSRGVTLNFNGPTFFNRTTTITTRVPGDAFVNPLGGRLVFNGNVDGAGGLTILTPLAQFAPGGVLSRLPQVAFNTDPITREGRLTLGFLRINAERAADGQFIDGQPVRTTRPFVSTVVFNYNGFVDGKVGSYAMDITSDFSMGPREQLLSYGPMDITALGGMLLSDINVLGDPGTTNNFLRLTTANDAFITAWTRQRRLDDPSTPDFNEFDIGTSIVAQGFIDINGISTITTREQPGIGAGNNNFVFFMRPEGSSFTEAVNGRVQRRIFSSGDQIDIRRLREGGLNSPPPIAPFELALNSFPIGFIQAIGDDEINLAEVLAAAIAATDGGDAVGAEGNLSAQQIESLARLSIFVRRPGALELMPSKFGKVIIDTSRNPRLSPEGRFVRSENATDYSVAEQRLKEERVDKLLADFDGLFNADLSGAESVKSTMGSAWDAYAAQAAGGSTSGEGFRTWLEQGNNPAALDVLNRARDLFVQLEQLGLSETELVFPKRTVAGLISPKPEMLGQIMEAIVGTKPSLAVR